MRTFFTEAEQREIDTKEIMAKMQKYCHDNLGDYYESSVFNAYLNIMLNIINHGLEKGGKINFISALKDMGLFEGIDGHFILTEY